MCSDKKFIYTRKMFLNRLVDPIGYMVPCGQCELCQQRKMQDKFVRLYYEYKYFHDHGGFTLTDTLSYNPEHLPHKYGMACFSRRDCKNFFKHLRDRITDHLVKVNYPGMKKTEARNLVRSSISGKLKYNLYCEFGDDDRFTHRPHYHIILNCMIPGIDPLLLNKFVVDSWVCYKVSVVPRKRPYKGKTTKKVRVPESLGINDRSKPVFSRVVNSKYALEYITEYLHKDLEYQKVREQIVNQMLEEGYTEEQVKDLDVFTLSSIDYGYSHLLNYIDEEKIYKDGCINITNSGKSFDYPVPCYLRSKLYHNITIDPSSGLVKRELNELGLKRAQQDLLRQVKKVYDTSLSYINSSKNIIDDDDHSRDRIYDLLDGRSLIDYSNYVVFYRNRLTDGNLLDRRDIISYVGTLTDYTLDNYNPLSNAKTLSTQDKKRIIGELRFHSIHENFCRDFRGFDMLYKIFEDFEKVLSQESEKVTFERREARKAIRLLKKLSKQ